MDAAGDLNAPLPRQINFFTKLICWIFFLFPEEIRWRWRCDRTRRTKRRRRRRHTHTHTHTKRWSVKSDDPLGHLPTIKHLCVSQYCPLENGALSSYFVGCHWSLFEVVGGRPLDTTCWLASRPIHFHLMSFVLIYFSSRPMARLFWNFFFFKDFYLIIFYLIEFKFGKKLNKNFEKLGKLI